MTFNLHMTNSHSNYCHVNFTNNFNTKVAIFCLVYGVGLFFSERADTVTSVVLSALVLDLLH
uniref:Uncharacterized protein n=1 Tax=Rhizophora mucronata TaxID=61149 RepID=A0A2P2N9C6_RHIMU